MKEFKQSNKLSNVFYDIRGEALDQAKRMEDEGQRILKLNIGNPSAFGLQASDEIMQDVIHNLPQSQGYCDSKGLYSARKAILQECQNKLIEGVTIDDIYIGNGVSELIVLSMQTLLNNGDEILIPSPDYPLWTGAVSLSGGKPVHYLCDESADWEPNIEDIASKITSKTKGIVVINPNNPTGAVYSRQILQEITNLAEKHNLIVFADEIYDKIVYEDAEYIPLASLTDHILFITFNGLSKSSRLAGFRSGWMVISGAKKRAKSYIEGLEILSNMRLCANVPAQHAIQAALGGYQSIKEFINPGGRLIEQRDTAYKILNDIPGVSCVKPKGAIYLFPKIDPDIYPIHHDAKLILDLLITQKILLVEGSAFNWKQPDHVRIVFLPEKKLLADAMEKFRYFLQHYEY